MFGTSKSALSWIRSISCLSPLVTIGCLTQVCIAVPTSPPLAVPDGVVDQEFLPHQWYGHSKLTEGAPIGQVFTLALGAIDWVQFQFSNGGGVVRIDLHDGASASDPVIASSLSVPIDGPVAHFDFPERVAITPEQRYFLETVHVSGTVAHLLSNQWGNYDRGHFVWRNQCCGPGNPWFIEGMVGAIPFDGDYNLDGIVDAGDYTVWRDTMGQNVAPGNGADGDGDGFIGLHDYSFWKERFGNSLNISTATVPESSAALMAFLSLGALIARHRR